MIYTYKIRVTTTGSAGSATGTGVSDEGLTGLLRAVHVDYTSMPATTDVTISTTAAPTVTFLTLTNTNTDGWYYPMIAAHTNAGAAITYDGTRPIYTLFGINDIVTVSVAQADALANAVIVTLLMERER